MRTHPRSEKYMTFRTCFLVYLGPYVKPARAYSDQLILKKISKIGAARCQILRLKCTKFDFRCGSAPDSAAEAYSAPPDLLAAFKGAYTSKRREGE